MIQTPNPDKSHSTLSTNAAIKPAYKLTPKFFEKNFSLAATRAADLLHLLMNSNPFLDF